jgi:hypothetical protein
MSKKDEDVEINQILAPSEKFISDLMNLMGNYKESNAIDIEKLQVHSKGISTLTKYISAFTNHLNGVKDTLSTLENYHNRNIAEFDKILNKLKNSNSDVTQSSIHSAVIPSTKQILKKEHDVGDSDSKSWKLVNNKKRGKVELESIEDKYAISSVDYKKIYIAENYYLPAISVPVWESINDMNNGILYYIESCNQFAIKLAGILFHGNIGIIYTNEKDPIKIKNCRFGKDCMKETCDFYHDPLVTPNCSDCRNFIAGSWLYAPPIHPFKNNNRARRFGSKENISIDLPSLSDEEKERFVDQTMHDILCSLLIKNNNI